MVTVLNPQTLDEATDVLADLGAAGAVLAGGTWIMRAAARAEQPQTAYVMLDQIDQLRGWQLDTELVIGAMTTHHDLARLTEPSAAALARAAAISAFPAVRSIATLGGNVCARPFPESDLLPALLALDARVCLAVPGTQRRMALGDYLPERATRPPGELVTGVSLPKVASRRSGFARMTVRAGGEYALASVAVAVDIVDDVVTGARVAIGAAESIARLLPDTAATLVGRSLDPRTVAVAGRTAADECRSRDGHDAPAWYRSAILPVLLARACALSTTSEDA